MSHPTDNDQQSYQRLMYANVCTNAFWPMVDILSLLCKLDSRG